MGIATLTACFVNSNRDPKKGEPAKPGDFFYFLSTDDTTNIPANAANAFFSLADTGLLPNWVIAIAPIEKLANARNHHQPPANRALIGEDLVLICPRLEGGVIKCAIAFTAESLPDTATVRNPDTNEVLTIVAKDLATSAWILQPELLPSN